MADQSPVKRCPAARVQIHIEGARAPAWITASNLQHWFDIAREDLIKSGLVVKEETV